ncbi:MAG: copper resistance protein [Pseudolabrys sp.]|nr:copper resistance protein [Pseudolabrys sp.]MSP33142.1 copper resistance protein [Pseudolabrys sp.]
MRTIFSFALVTLAGALISGAAFAGSGTPGHSHGGFSAGQPGNPKKPSRTIQIAMHEADGKMGFAPETIQVRKGEQIKFLLRNTGALDHEFVLATVKENLKHAELMKKYPEMEHDDPNAKRLAPEKAGEVLWRFTKSGSFEFACLIPGHREAGMHGKIIVK